jgi:hypothetical protein
MSILGCDVEGRYPWEGDVSWFVILMVRDDVGPGRVAERVVSI